MGWRVWRARAGRGGGVRWRVGGGAVEWCGGRGRARASRGPGFRLEAPVVSGPKLDVFLLLLRASAEQQRFSTYLSSKRGECGENSRGLHDGAVYWVRPMQRRGVLFCLFFYFLLPRPRGKAPRFHSFPRFVNLQYHYLHLGHVVVAAAGETLRNRVLLNG